MMFVLRLSAPLRLVVYLGVVRVGFCVIFGARRLSLGEVGMRP